MRIYEKLITDDKVDLLLAPWGTPFHIAIAPVLEKYKFPVVGNTAASVALRQIKPGYIWFPTSAIPDRIGVELTAMMKAANVKSAAIVSNVLPFSKEIKNYLEPELKKAGIEVKHSTEYPPDVKDMTATLTQVKQANVDAVLALAYPGDAMLYAKQAKELGITAPFQFIAIGPSAAFFAKVVGAASAEGVVTIAHWSPRPEWKGSQAFYDAYVKKFGEDAGLPRLRAAVDVARDPAERGRQGGPRQGEDPRRSSAKDTFETINGKVRFEGVQNVDHADGLRADAEGQAPDRLAASRSRPASTSPRRAGRAARPDRVMPTLDTLLSGQLLFAALVTGSLYALIALGLNLVYGTMRMLNVAHGDLVMLGAYAAYWAFTVARACRRSLAAPVDRALGALAGYRALPRRCSGACFAGAGRRPARVEGNSLLLFFGLSIILQNAAALAFTPNNRGYQYLDRGRRIGNVAMTATASPRW